MYQSINKRYGVIESARWHRRWQHQRSIARGNVSSGVKTYRSGMA